MNEIEKCVKFIKDNYYIYVNVDSDLRGYYKLLFNNDTIKISFLSNHISYFYEIEVRINDVIIGSLPIDLDKLKEFMVTNELIQRC